MIAFCTDGEEEEAGGLFAGLFNLFGASEAQKPADEDIEPVDEEEGKATELQATAPSRAVEDRHRQSSVAINPQVTHFYHPQNLAAILVATICNACCLPFLRCK